MEESVGKMHLRIIIFFFLVIIRTSIATTTTKPNIVFVLADDFGHANIGYHRRDENGTAKYEVHTPNLDSLADDGVILTNHYAYKICSPSRSSLQSGRLATHVNTVNTGVTVANPKDPTSGFAGIPKNMTCMANKLKLAGYDTHAVGKWDCGCAIVESTPLGRGYDDWIGYYQHANAYYKKDATIQSVGEIDNCMNKFRDFSLLNETYRGGVPYDHDLDPNTYEEDVFKAHALSLIERKKNSSVPFFLFYAFHLVHTPLQVPQDYLDRIDKIVKEPFDTQNRRLYAAMVLYMDEAVGELVSKLQDSGLWDNTLLVFVSDNGGPIYEPGAANNYPRRGGKYNDFQGGVNTNAFVTGGFVPEDVRGNSYDGVVSIADWYSTFCFLANVTDEDDVAKRAGLPPVDGKNQWNAIIQNTQFGPRHNESLHLSANAVLRWPWKLVTGRQPYGTWQSPRYPNCSTVKTLKEGQGPGFVDFKIFNVQMKYEPQSEADEIMWIKDCGDSGCLFNLEKDPNEHDDVSSTHLNLASELLNELSDMNRTLFEPDRGDMVLEACDVAISQNRFVGPFLNVPNDWYTPPPKPSEKQKLEDDSLREELKLIDKEKVNLANDFQKIYKSWSKIELSGMDKCI